MNEGRIEGLKLTSADGILRADDIDVARNQRFSNHDALRRRESLQRSWHRRMKPQRLMYDGIEVIEARDVCVQHVTVESDERLGLCPE